MITVKQILEQYSLVSDKATEEEIKLSALSEAGIFESSKLPMIRRSLKKNINEMTEAERKTLKSLLESLMDHTLLNEKSMSYPSDKDMPTVIILKRKAIRVFPDNQKIGLYYSQALDRYISIPFGPNIKDLSPQLNEEKRTSIADLHGQQLANRWAELSPEKRTQLGGKLLPSQRSQVAGGNRAALKYIATANAPLSVKLGAGLGVIARGLVDKVRGKGTKITPTPQQTTPVTTSTQQATPKAPTAKSERVVGSGATRKPPQVNRPKSGMNESFIANLKLIREKREYGKADAALDAASFLPGPAGTAASLASAGMSLSRKDYTGAALDVAGALPGIGYLAKRAKVARAGTKAVKQLPKTSRVRTIARTIGRGSRAVAKALAGAGSASDSNNEPLFKKTDSQYDFGKSLTSASVGGPGERASVDPSRARAWQTAGVSGIQNPVYNESNNLSTIKKIVENNVSDYTLQIDEETISINKSVAKKIVKLHESLNRTNQKKLEKMLNEDIVSFRKVINFALKQ